MTYGAGQWRPWAFNPEVSRPHITPALENDINFFDSLATLEIRAFRRDDSWRGRIASVPVAGTSRTA
jgi:hypothetical protein